MIKKFTFISDPGHGWLKVPFSLIEKLGIVDHITRYSYQRYEFVYLEEDCDAPLFLEAYKKHYGFSPVAFREQFSNKNSKIRSYYPYDKTKASSFANIRSNKR